MNVNAKNISQIAGCLLEVQEVFTVAPLMPEGNVRYLEINLPKGGKPPTAFLNALDKAGFIEKDGAFSAHRHNMPRLKIVSVTRDLIVLED